MRPGSPLQVDQRLHDSSNLDCIGVYRSLELLCRLAENGVTCGIQEHAINQGERSSSLALLPSTTIRSSEGMQNTVQKPGNYLSIDGGLTAACGLCALYILNEMFERLQWDLKSDTMLLPCEVFEIIIGTGFGGLIAILLGPLRLSPSQAIEAYEKLIPALSVATTIDDEERKRNTEAFKTAFSAVLVDAKIPVDAPMIGKDVSKTIVCTLKTTAAATPFLLRSYRSRGTPPDCTILQAACATVASLDKFMPTTLGLSHLRIDLTDAVVGYANPTQLLLREAQAVLGENAKVATVVSIGLGKVKVSITRDPSQQRVAFDRLKQVATNCEQVHRELEGRLKETGVYSRFNIDWDPNSEESVLSSTSTYLDNEEVNNRLNEAAKSIQCRAETISLKDINAATTVTLALKPRPSLVRNFVGREDILDAMRHTHVYSRSPDPGLPAITVLTGLGGSGKTQIALRFALEYEERYRGVPVYFLDARSEDKLKADFELAIRARDTSSRSKSHEDALNWFSSRKDKWFIIMDNADDPSVELSRFIPKSSHGNVIITTRNSMYKTLASNSSHHVEGLASSDAVDLILRGASYKDNEENKAHAKKIAEAVGYLPLALAHAAGYISVHRCLTTYLGMFLNSRAKFLSSKPALLQDYNPTISATMELSLNSTPQAARDLMTLLARFDASSIAQSIIVKAAERQFRRICRSVEGDVLDSQTIEQADALMAIFCPSGKWLESDFNYIIEQCLQYSLLQVTVQGQARFYSMHILVQAYLQSHPARVQQFPVERLVIRLLGSAITCDDNYKYHAFNRLLYPHLRLVEIDHVTEAGDYLGLGHVLREQGNARLSSQHFERCLAVRRSSLGDENVEVVTTMVNLASSYGDLGRHKDALDLKMRVLRLLKQSSGDEHPDTVRAMANLATSYSDLGRHWEALELELKVLNLRKRLLGDKHPDTVLAMGNLASSYSDLGMHHEALLLEVKVLDQRKRLSGDEHPDTVLAMGNLASSYSDLGKHQEALDLRVEVLDLWKRVSGDDHPDTVRAMANLAMSYRDLGRHLEALELEKKVLYMRTELLGEGHPVTLLSVWNLSGTLHKLGEKERAIALLQAAVPLQEKALGMDHPWTIGMRKWLNNFLERSRWRDSDHLESPFRSLPPGHPLKNSGLSTHEAIHSDLNSTLIMAQLTDILIGLTLPLHPRFGKNPRVSLQLLQGEKIIDKTRAVAGDENGIWEIESPINLPNTTQSLTLAVVVHSQDSKRRLVSATFRIESLFAQLKASPNEYYEFTTCDSCASLQVILSFSIKKKTSIIVETLSPHPVADVNRYLAHEGTTRNEQKSVAGESSSFIREGLRCAYIKLAYSPNSDEKWNALSNIGHAYHALYQESQDADDLDNSISIQREAVNLGCFHPQLAQHLEYLSSALEDRYIYSGNRADIDEAIQASQNALGLMQRDTPERADLLIQLASNLKSRFKRLGDVVDIDMAVSTYSEGVTLMPEGSPQKARGHNYFACALFQRFGRLGVTQDLDRAIVNLESAMSLTPDGHPDKPSRYNNLGIAFQYRFGRLGDLTDLNNAISNHENAVNLTPDGHPDKPSLYNNLGNAIELRFNRLGDLADLEMAISNNQNAVNLTPDGHPAKPLCNTNLGIALRNRFARLGDLADLNNAIFSQENAVRLTPDGHPDQPSRFSNLGISFQPRLWVEQGRSIVWQNLLRLRAPVDELRAVHPAITDHLQSISQQLGVPAGRELIPQSRQDKPPLEIAKSHTSLAIEWDEAVDRIWKLPDFESFLKPKAFDTLAPAVHEGPVIILNVAEDRCDALVLIPGSSGDTSVVSIPLTRFSLKQSEKLLLKLTTLLLQVGVRNGETRKPTQQPRNVEIQKGLKSILYTLWVAVVKPVLDGLAYQPQHRDMPHIWWCVTGPLSFLPIHAAATELGQKVSDYAVSSYTPTLTAILDSSYANPSQDFKFLTVAQPSTPGYSMVPKTMEEVERILKIAGSGSVVNLTKEEATVEQVQKEMKESHWVRLACHGKQDASKPIESGLIFYDGTLKLSTIIKESLPNADFAFLSACQTEMGDKKVAGESVHLAAGMLLAGYKGVIATMWSIRDDDGPQVAEGFTSEC